MDKYYLIIIILFCFLLNGCKHDNLFSNDVLSKKRDLSLDEARTFFSQEFAKKTNFLGRMGITDGTSHIHDESCEHNTDKRPMWDGYKYRTLSFGGQAVLVPLYKEGVYIEISDKVKVKYGFLNYMMMYKDSAQNIITEWVQLRPSLEWLTTKTNKTYEGSIIIKNWEGKILKKYNYQNGIEITQHNLLRNEKTIRSSSNKKHSSTPSTQPDTSALSNCITTTYSTTIGATTCSCSPAHRWGQACTCESIGGVGPTKGKKMRYQVVECFDGPDPVAPPTGEGNNGSDSSTGGSGSGMGGSSQDYPPMNCNLDPDYTISTTPPPAGMEYMLPCSSIPIPIEETDSPENPTPVTTSKDLLIFTFSAYGLIIPNLPELTDERSLTLLNFIKQREDNEDLVKLVYWGINTMWNKEMTWEQFENWFLSKTPPVAEYMAHDKGINNPTYWLNASFPQKSIPDFKTFSDNFPKRSSVAIATLASELGGDIGNFIETQIANQSNFNTCGIRLSVALQKSGVTIPDIPDPNGGTRRITLADKDGNHYFIRADEMDIWMQLTFGTYDGKARFMNLALTKVLERNTHINNQHRQYIKPESLKDKRAPEDIVKDFVKEGKSIDDASVKRGIYSLISESIIFATGHVDLLDEAIKADGGKLYLDYPALKILNIWNF